MDLSELVPSAIGGKRRPAPPLQVEVVRSLGPDDLELIINPPAVNVPAPSLLHVRYVHHQLAMYLAKGVRAEEISLITGYTPATISRLKNDPAFKQLLAHYNDQSELAFVDVLERMKTLGLSTLDELQRRLEEEPEGFAKRELMEMFELMLVKGRGVPGGQSAGQGTGAGAGVTVNVKFVSASPTMLIEGGKDD